MTEITCKLTVSFYHVNPHSESTENKGQREVPPPPLQPREAQFPAEALPSFLLSHFEVLREAAL